MASTNCYKRHLLDPTFQRTRRVTRRPAAIMAGVEECTHTQAVTIAPQPAWNARAGSLVAPWCAPAQLKLAARVRTYVHDRIFREAVSRRSRGGGPAIVQS